MALETLDFEGLTDGVTVDAASAGVDTVTISSGNTMLGRAGGAALVGSKCIELNVNSANSCIFEKAFTASDKTLYRFGVPLFVPTTPPAVTTDVKRFYGGSGGTTVVARLNLTTTNTLTLVDTSGVHTSSAIDLSAYAGTWVEIRGWINAGTTSSDGSAKVRVYPNPTVAATGAYVGPGGATTEISVTNYSFGAGLPFIKRRFGFQVPQGASTPRQLRFDYLRDEDVVSASFLDGVPTASAPTVSVSTSDQYPAAGATITLQSTESGTFSSGTWSCTKQPRGAATPSISNPAITNPTVVLPTPGQYEFRRRLAWSGGNQDALITVYVHAASGNRAGLHAVVGTWSVQGGAVDLLDALTDGSISTYLKSSDNPTGVDILTVTFKPLDLGPVKIYPTDGWIGGLGASVTYTLYREDGTTVLATWTYNPGNAIAEAAPLSDALSALTTFPPRRALVLKIAPTV